MKKLLVLVTAVSFVGYTLEAQIENYKLSGLIGGYMHCKNISEGDPKCNSAQYTVSGYQSGVTTCNSGTGEKFHCAEGKGQIAAASETNDLLDEQASQADCNPADKWICRNVNSEENVTKDFRWLCVPQGGGDICGDQAKLVAVVAIAADPKCPKIEKPAE